MSTATVWTFAAYLLFLPAIGFYFYRRSQNIEDYLLGWRTTWQGALAGMITGAVVLVVWEQTPLSPYMYELAPGFVANCIAIVLVDRIVGRNDAAIRQEYAEVVDQVRRSTDAGKTGGVR